MENIFPGLPAPANKDVFEMLCIRAGEDGRDRDLFGGCIPRVIELIRPFIIGERFPGVFFECPLKGDPFLDVAVLYGKLRGDAAVESEYAAGCEELISCYSRMKKEHPSVCFGFELDTSKDDPGKAAVHFEPRTHTELVAPFCRAIGCDAYGELYLKTSEKLSDILPLSFFGMFRGRENAPLRVCGYLGNKARKTISEDKDTLLRLFNAAGFTAYDGAMLDDIVKVLELTPGEADYQLDIYPDGRAGDVFSLDIGLREQSAEAIRESFENGLSARLFSFLQNRGIADERTDKIGEMATSFAFPAKKETGEITGYAMIIQPVWIKVRWRGACLQNAKCYSKLRAGFISEKGNARS